jgi:hypothetical protein
MSRNIIGRMISEYPQQRLRDPTRTKPKASFRPRLETLEDRLAPSVFTVNGTGDTGTGIGLNGDLRYCITQANTNAGTNSIRFSPTVFGSPKTITLNSALPAVTDNHLTITGPGAKLATVSGNHKFQVFNITAANASLSGLTIANGNIGNNGMGGGILFTGAGTLAVSNTVISGNSAGHCGGGIYNMLTGTITLTNSTVSHNSAPYCGGIGSVGKLTLTDCTVSGNSATGSSGGIGTNNSLHLGTLTLTNSIVSGNSAHIGAGINTDGGSVSLTNSTLSGNSAFIGGGLNDDANAMVSLTNSTLSGNSAGNGVGGGISNDKSSFCHLNNTLIARNTGASGPDVFGAVSSGSGFNLIGNGSGMTGISNGVNGNHIGTSTSPINPLLATLGSYGGPTKTLALLPGSPALDAGSNALDGGATTDQRGRPRIVHGTVDIGAFESQGFTVTVSAGNNQSTVVNTPFASALTVTVSSSAGEPVAGGVVKFTAPSSGASAVLSAARVTLSGSGKGSVTATANNKAGSYQVVVSTRGANAKASFTLTNRAHAATLSAVVPSTSIPEAGVSFSLTVSALDAFNNQVSANRRTVYFASSDTAALAPGYTFTSTDVQAAAAFDSLAANGFGGGNWTPSLLDAFFAEEQREFGGAFIGRR